MAMMMKQRRSNKEMSQDDERPFMVQSVIQVNIRKFKTTGMSYRVRFTNALADVELANQHERLHQIFVIFRR